MSGCALCRGMVHVHHVQSHSCVSQYLERKVRLGPMTNADSGGNYRHNTEMFSIISCLPCSSYCLEIRLSLHST